MNFELFSLQAIGDITVRQYLNGDVVSIGCGLCFDENVELDQSGEPTISGQSLLRVQNTGMPNEVESNLWQCPRCFRLISSLIPQNALYKINR